MAELVTLQLSPIFTRFKQRVEGLRDEVLTEGGDILKREYQLSIRQRWFRTGATAASVQEEIVTEGNHKTFRLFPTATNDGTPYPLFGEYGTGRRGSSSGRPAPRGYRYSDRAGMMARRFSRIAVEQAKPQIVDAARLKLREFAGMR